VQEADPKHVTTIPVGVSLALALIGILALGWLVLPGMRWGLPSEGRNRLTFGKDRSAWRAPAAEDRPAWEAYPNMLPGGPERTGANPRSAYNPIRSYHPDEYVFLKSLSEMRPSKLKLFPGFFGWPALQFYVIGAGLKAASWAGQVELVPDQAFYFRNPEAMARLYLAGRFVTLLFAAGCVLATWAAARRLLGPGAAACAALLLAVTPLFTINSRYMTGDVPMLFWLALVLFFSAGIFNGAGRRTYILAGIALGLAAATRYQGALGGFMIAAAHLLRPEVHDKRWSRFARDRRIWIAAGTSILVFLICNPYVFVHPGQFLRELTSEAAGGTAGRGNFLVNALLQVETGLGIMLGAAFAASFWMAFVRRDRTAVYLLLGLGLPAALLAVGGPTMVRYMMPALLFPILLTAWAFARLHRRGMEIGKNASRVATPLLAVFVLLFTGWQSAAFGKLYSDPACDTRTLAGEYIAEYVHEGARIGVVSEPWQFELPPMDASKYRIVVGDPTLGPDGLAAKGPRLVIVSDLQSPPMAARAAGEGEAAFWRALWNDERPFHVIRRFEAWPAGQREFIEHGPQDMRYANPVIAVARCAAPAGTSGGTK
jgi:hypothetical protein